MSESKSNSSNSTGESKNPQLEKWIKVLNTKSREFEKLEDAKSRRNLFTLMIRILSGLSEFVIKKNADRIQSLVDSMEFVDPEYTVVCWMKAHMFIDYLCKSLTLESQEQLVYTFLSANC